MAPINGYSSEMDPLLAGKYVIPGEYCSGTVCRIPVGPREPRVYLFRPLRMQ
jgi:hypothetical protein